jgi:hypothetical protein
MHNCEVNGSPSALSEQQFIADGEAVGTGMSIFNFLVRHRFFPASRIELEKDIVRQFSDCTEQE